MNVVFESICLRNVVLWTNFYRILWQFKQPNLEMFQLFMLCIIDHLLTKQNFHNSLFIWKFHASENS